MHPRFFPINAIKMLFKYGLPANFIFYFKRWPMNADLSQYLRMIFLPSSNINAYCMFKTEITHKLFYSVRWFWLYITKKWAKNYLLLWNQFENIWWDWHETKGSKKCDNNVYNFWNYCWSKLLQWLLVANWMQFYHLRWFMRISCKFLY